jgi:hypothetical protein
MGICNPRLNHQDFENQGDHDRNAHMAAMLLSCCHLHVPGLLKMKGQSLLCARPEIIVEPEPCRGV